MARREHIDDILRNWPYNPSSISARVSRAAEGREVLQMRVDMGLLQMEITGRPDGEQPYGYETFLDYLISIESQRGDNFVLSEDECIEVDREFVQFYHRRVCWLKLRRYREAVDDADHSLSLMNFCLHHAPDENWLLSHEQYRPFVLFHRIQAAALACLEEDGPEAAVQEVNGGLGLVRDLFDKHDMSDQFEEDELVQRLFKLRESLREEYNVGRTLQERLADAVAAEQYELAARLRDELARREQTRS